MMDMAAMFNVLLQQETLSNDELLRMCVEGQCEMPLKPLKRKNTGDGTTLLQISEQQDPKNFPLLLKAHTDGLCFSPSQTPLAGTHYVRRSSVLLKLKFYKEALQDIDLAFEHPISNKEKDEITLRKEIITRLLEEQKPEVKDAEEQVGLSYGENNTIPGTSSAITFAYNKTDGRHFVATQSIKIGDILMIQKPYAYFAIQDPEDPNLFEDPKYICNNCLNYTVAPIPCKKCVRTFYCSRKCRSEAYDKFHRTECKLPTANDKGYNLGMRLLMIITQQGEKLQEMINLAKKQDTDSDKMNTGFLDGKFDGNSVEAVLSLPNYMDTTKNTIFTRHAGMLAAQIQRRTDFLPNEIDAFTLGKFILPLIYIFAMNNLKIKRESNSNIVAFGLYPTLSQMKHSCVSNTITYNDNNNTVIVYAVRDIEKGDQISNSCISHEEMIEITVQQRKNFVQACQNYICNCEACKSNYKFKLELKDKIKIPMDLKKSLRENPKDVKCLWELLKLIHDQYKSPCLEIKLIELGLLDALMGKANIQLSKAFSALGII